MNISSHYKIQHFIPWTRHHIYKMFVLSIVPVLLYVFAEWYWLALPWVPIALIGTATAFIAGFKNTQTYNRTWEARQIWGGIINSSRAFGIMTRDYINFKDASNQSPIHKTIIYRHFAWLTALRFQLREVKPWENIRTKSYNREYLKYYHVPEWASNIQDELDAFLSADELAYILTTKNKATQILALQSAHLTQLNSEGKLNDFYHVALENIIKDLYDLQGKSERIKNFPYPRQYSSINLYFTQLLCALIPLGFLGELSKHTDQIGNWFIWLTIPLSIIVGWIFLVLEQIGESTENPFEGGANDIPITQISQNIEIDLREMLGETQLPTPFQPQNNIIM